jgi:signal transduction histidine kinase
MKPPEADVAHELATPIQYVGNNLVFVRELAAAALAAVAEMRAAVSESGDAALVARIAEITRRFELPYFEREAPDALDAIDEGIARIASIVRAMKDLSNPAELDRFVA